jgi:hypothetical protein
LLLLLLLLLVAAVVISAARHLQRWPVGELAGDVGDGWRGGPVDDAVRSHPCVVRQVVEAWVPEFVCATSRSCCHSCVCGFVSLSAGYNTPIASLVAHVACIMVLNLYDFNALIEADMLLTVGRSDRVSSLLLRLCCDP